MIPISVIVPVYRVEKYLHRCVDSILNQTFGDFDLILVDDGSPDRSGVICDEYAAKDSRIEVIHKENGGLSSARNAGIEAARGEYLCFVDSDDVIHPDCLKILMTCIQNTGAEIALGKFTRFQEDCVPENRFGPWTGNCVTRTNLETLDCFFEDPQNLPSLVSACGTLWHRCLFADIRFPAGRLFEDEFTTYKLYHKASSVGFVDMELYFYFVNDSGITQNLTVDKRFDEYDAQWERLEYFAEHNLVALQGKAVMTFLKTAQWDLIECRRAKVSVNAAKKRFEEQYIVAFEMARKHRCLDFLRDYDFYVLAKPDLTLFWRLRRKLQLLLRKG